jgi:hypothetical protein
MLRQAWIAALTTALLTTAVSARSLEIRYWPPTFVPQELVDIPVVMDVHFWMDIAVQGEALKLEPVSAHRFEGCLDVHVRCNFNARLLYSIVATGVIGGQYSCFPEYTDIDVPGGTATVRARLDNADLSKVPGGSRNVHVATIVVKVIPRP